MGTIIAGPAGLGESTPLKGLGGALMNSAAGMEDPMSYYTQLDHGGYIKPWQKACLPGCPQRKNVT